MSKVFKSDVFDWARDLAIIQRIFGASGSHDEANGPCDVRTIRPAAVPQAESESLPGHPLVQAVEERKS